MIAITEALWLGPFAARPLKRALVASKITHLLNVSDQPSELRASARGFREVAWHPIVDRVRIPHGDAASCLGTLHRMVCQDGARVYVHCSAGWKRSPTVVWLYLVACGTSPRAARSLIERRAPEATPGHSDLVDGALVDHLLEFGKAHLRPHPRPEALRPA